jgi:Tol biopolymer transport system component
MNSVNFICKKRRGSIALLFFSLAILPSTSKAQVDYSVVQVKEESGSDLTKITNDIDCVAMPIVKRNNKGVEWFTNRILDTSPDSKTIAFLSIRNGTVNIYTKDLNNPGSSVQRTNKQTVYDFSYSPDGKYICFASAEGNNMNQIFQTSATSGYICRQITSDKTDYSPVYSPDMKNIFFTRMEGNLAYLWGYNVDSKTLSSYAKGMNPCVANEPNCLLYTRFNNMGRGEIWRFNYATGAEDCIVSDPKRSFSTPSLSPDGKWIVMVGTNMLMNGTKPYYDTDIFACHTDGTQLIQLTYHAADDLSPVWSRDGKYIYFISQRGSASATANIWRMKFTH